MDVSVVIVSGAAYLCLTLNTEVTMRRITLLASLVLAACGSDDPEVAAELRVVIVDGDRQVDTVATVPQEPAASPIPADVRIAAEMQGLQILDEPFVARLVGAPTSSASLTGPSAAVVAAGAEVAWVRPDEASGCTRPFYAQTVADDSGYVTNFGIKGTRAGPCPIHVGRMVEDSSGNPAVVLDTTFVVTQLPGPAAAVTLPSIVRLLEAEAWTPANDAVRDAHGNRVPFAVAVAGAGSVIGDVSVNGGPWGAGTIDILSADTVVRQIPLRTFPDLQATSQTWLWELTCTTPDTTYVDRLVFRVAAAVRDNPYPRLPAGADPDDVMQYRNPGRGVSRTVIANGDAIYSVGADQIHAAMLWPTLDAVTLEVVWDNSYDPNDADDHWMWHVWSYSEGVVLEGVPARIPLATRSPLEWRTDQAAPACVSDGFGSATAGVLSIRPHS